MIESNLALESERIEDLFPDKKETSKPREVLNSVCDELSLQLSPKRKTELETAKQTAIRFVEKFGINQELFDISKPENYERIIQLILVANEWQETSTFSSQERVMNIFRKIYGTDDRRRRMIGLDKVEHFYGGIPDVVLTEIFRLMWPESNGDPNWIKKNKAKDSIVIAPMKNFGFGRNTGLAIQKKAYQNMKHDLRKAIYFDGIAMRDQGFYLAFKDANRHTLVHESLHMNNPGLIVGFIGVGLEEGMTELLTEEISGKRRLLLLNPYPDETRFLKQLFAKNPGLKDVFVNKYKIRNHENVRRYYQTLIDTFGLSKTMSLYLMVDHAENIPKEVRYKHGIEVTSDVAERFMEKKIFVKKTKLNNDG